MYWRHCCVHDSTSTQEEEHTPSILHTGLIEADLQVHKTGEDGNEQSLTDASAKFD